MVLAGGGGGAVYLGIGDGSTTSNTTVALTNCTMKDSNAAGLCLAGRLIINYSS